MRRSLLLLALALPTGALAAPVLHQYKAVAISPDGRNVAAIETDDLVSDTAPPTALVIHDLSGASRIVALPCEAGPNCKVASPSWSADGRHLAFLLAHDADNTADIEQLDLPEGAAPIASPRRLLAFDGPLDTLRYGPGDRLAVLATANAHKHVGRTEAAAPQTGEIGNGIDEQRIAILDGPSLRFISPPDLYVYEFDWRPDGGFVGTAAHGDGDANWWIARLYAFDRDGHARQLFAPGPREQLADPVVSPDGGHVAFIGGWMSDQGSTGGDAYLLPLDRAASPTDLTPNSAATVTALDWRCGDGLTGTTLAGDSTIVRRLDRLSAPLWSGPQSVSAGGWNLSLSCGAGGAAAIAETFTAPPEIVAGPVGHWHPVTHANAGLPAASFTARSVSWTSDGHAVQGWLLVPAAPGPTPRRPMIVLVHGGPEAAATPEFPPSRDAVRSLLAQGWDVFEPNYRGSFGQGEAFASASIQDLGGGDWRDVLSGVDAAERAAPIDDARLGITGGSYGGYMTMWAATQTHRFRAGVSDAGVSDWLSLEGEAPQAGSDEVNFGGSVYDNDAPYLRASPITYMRGVTTPVLIAVGERDVECPMPQSLEYYTAMKAVGAPTSFVVYAGEGHALRREADRTDLTRRTVAWFRRWFDAPARPH